MISGRYERISIATPGLLFRGIVADKAHRGRHGQQAMTTRCWFAVIAVLFAVLAAGCTDSGGAGSDNDRQPVFYGGVSGGGTRP
jgi:hypothetical protein